MLAKVRVKINGQWAEFPLTPSIIKMGVSHVLNRSFSGDIKQLAEELMNSPEESGIEGCELVPGTYIVGNGVSGCYVIRELNEHDQDNLFNIEKFFDECE